MIYDLGANPAIPSSAAPRVAGFGASWSVLGFRVHLQAAAEDGGGEVVLHELRVEEGHHRVRGKEHVEARPKQNLASRSNQIRIEVCDSSWLTGGAFTSHFTMYRSN